MNHSQRIGYDFLIAFLSTSMLVLIIILVLIFICKKKPIQSQEPQPTKVTATSLPLTKIDSATDGFSRRRIIGEGRLGTVYAAVLDHQGEFVAAKRIHPRLVLSNAGFGFSTVLKSLSLAQHPNIVPILGFSEAPGERIVVSEFVGSASLDFYLHQNPDGVSLLDWSRRLRIAAGAAKGLEYLHEGVAPNIVHGCVKASNILIDVNFCARICDYGLSFLGPRERRGIVGHVDDEYWASAGGGAACKESDVFGFGVVLLELLTGRQCEQGLLVKWSLPLIKEMRFNELLDPRLVFPSDVKPFVRLGKVALACVGNSRKNRPSIGQVAVILSNLEIP
ncbi:serine/threonine-protein kinase-like protein ACR4 [Cannabis sativa]|uniref:serine/threonine-protein kinase-like protein ACR4 n=1 Tax=Cannabis sativa TaxID=3483 RepID=UPI0011DF143C|nr:serine/threonine-protein kinase-like protein ACR4 [Cannabis sativa]